MISFGDFIPHLKTQFTQTLLPDVMGIVITLAIPTLTLLLIAIWWPLWLNYVRSKRFIGVKFAVFEIKLPKETFKSPRAMELFLHCALF